MTEDHAGRLAGLLKRAENAIRYVIRRTDDEMVIEKSKELLTETTAALADWRAHGGWRDISTAPKDGTPILWRGVNGNYCVIYWPTYRECFEEGKWRPLPPPPEDRNG